jgi:periodic tryptophan protein 1
MMFLAFKQDFASLEIYVYDQKNGNLFVHHDIPLPAFPLCLAHGPVSHHALPGNFCAVGTFSPGIEIWNLDVLNALEPSCVLGGEDNSITDELMKLQILNAATGSVKQNTNNSKTKSKQVSRSNRNGLRQGSHTDAVMSLSWNPIHKQVIASGSADRTVKLWDVTRATSDDANATTYTHHKNKVQAVAWNPHEGTLLATGSYDRTVAILDARTNGSNKSNIKQVRISADCETIKWDPIRTEYLTVVSEDGIINCWDVRKFDTSTPLWSFSASEFGGVTDLSYNSHVPGLMVTCSIDKTITLWDAHNVDASTSKVLPPKPCGNKDMCVGKLYSVGFYPSAPWLLGCGGSGNELALWDLSSEESIQKGFQGRMGLVVAQQESSYEFTDHVSRPTLDESFDAMMNDKNKMKEDDDMENCTSIAKETSSSKKKKKNGKTKPKVHRKI